MKTINLGLIGLGTVNSALVNLLENNKQVILNKYNLEFKIIAACVHNPNKTRDCDTQSIVLTDNIDKLINNQEIDIIVEAIGEPDTAKNFALKALKANKPLVTANKAMLALYGDELFNLASDNQVPLLYEAAVAGGIPIIKTIREGLAANNIKAIKGIINGTCNYILTKMATEQIEFKTILAKAQELGYAEAEPSLDIDGIDAAHKIALLAANSFGVKIDFSKVYIEGITKLEPYDFTATKTLNFVIKHLAIANLTKQGISIAVHPILLKPDHPLANINDVMNAVMVETDLVGPLLFAGAGAGGSATASAITADLIDIVNDNFNAKNYYGFKKLQDFEYLDINDTVYANYLRIMADDKAGVLTRITKFLANNNINVESILQNKMDSKDGIIPVVLITNAVTNDVILSAIYELEQQDFISGKVIRIRIDV